MFLSFVFLCGFPKSTLGISVYLSLASHWNAAEMKQRLQRTHNTIDNSEHFCPLLSLQLRTDAEKRSLVESGLSWYSEDHKAGHKLDSGSYETGSLKTEAPSKWRKKPPSLSEDFGCKGELKKPQSLGQPGSFRKGRNPPVGVTSPITHTSQSTLKVAGEILWYFFLLFFIYMPLFFQLFIFSAVHLL